MLEADTAVAELDISQYDKNKIEDFRNSIEIRNNEHYVYLSWYEDKINSVPSTKWPLLCCTKCCSL